MCWFILIFRSQSDSMLHCHLIWWPWPSWWPFLCKGHIIDKKDGHCHWFAAVLLNYYTSWWNDCGHIVFSLSICLFVSVATALPVSYDLCLIQYLYLLCLFLAWSIDISSDLEPWDMGCQKQILFFVLEDEDER